MEVKFSVLREHLVFGFSYANLGSLFRNFFVTFALKLTHILDVMFSRMSAPIIPKN